MKQRKAQKRLDRRRADFDETVKKNGVGRAGRGILIRMPNGKVACYHRPGSRSK